MEIEFYNNLNINKENSFEYHMNYLQENIVSFTMESYIKKIVGEKYKSDFMSIKDFKSIITIRLYSTEFKIEESELNEISTFLDKFDYINKNYKTLDFVGYYNNNIKSSVNDINKLFKKIMNGNITSVCDGYCKIYYNVNKFLECEKIEDKNMKIELELFRDQYYNLMKQILKGETDNYIKKESLKLESDNEYDSFRKSIFLDNLERDLTGIEKKYNGIVYLLDIIRIKLCNISPVSKKYEYMKERINDILDISFIKQKIDNNVFDKSELINILSFVVEKIKEYQDEMEDKILDKWVDDIMKNKVSVMDDSNINKILPQIMGEVMDKLEKIEEKVVKYRKTIYENLEEK
tara:strand:- start:2910 stop:3956 length:1047 start_codon:yes stop_codon:yes gene_type:complete